MSDFCFSFLEMQYRDIYLDCARMDKNLIEGDGVESILIAGRIAEKVTKAIFEYEGFKESNESQYKRLEKLKNANILPKNIYNDFRELRRLRNDVYHNTLTSRTLGLNSNHDKGYNKYSKITHQGSSSGLKDYKSSSGGLRDYKTGFSVEKKEKINRSSRTKTPNHIKFQKSRPNSKYDHSSKSDSQDGSSSKTNSDIEKSFEHDGNSNSQYSTSSSSASMDFSAEMVAAREAHKLTFNICVWFNVNYSGDKDFIRPQYKLNKRTQDSDFLIRLKSAVNDGDAFIKLAKSNPNNEIISILRELHVPNEEDEKDDDLVYGLDSSFKIRQPNGPYSKEVGIHYDDNVFMWEARHGGKSLGYFQSSKEAFEAREVYIHSLPIPPKVDGGYSKENGISFSRIQKLWTASVKGRLIAYYPSEKAAVKGRKKYLKAHDLVDIEVENGYRTVSKKEYENLKSKSSLDSKSKNLKSKSKKESLESSNSSKSSSKISGSSDGFKSKSNENLKQKSSKNSKKSKVKVEKGSKVSKNTSKKVKVSGGQRVSKKKKSKSKTISKRKSSKYEGVYYEEGLFMWSAEVDGKHLGLFSSEKEAHQKREEYLNSRS